MSSGFIKESEIEEAKKKRQEEWEKVRNADDPEEAPEADYDPRSLFERLKEQKDKKDLEFEESRKLKNLIRGLDDDEVEYLDYVDQVKMTNERKTMEEERNELKDFREKVASLQQQSLDEKLQIEAIIPKPKTKIDIPTNRLSQKSILASGIKRKTVSQTATEPPNKKSTATAVCNNKITDSDSKKSALQCVAILPGIGSYSSSNSEASGDEDSTDSDSNQDTATKFDFVGRKVIKKQEECDSDD